MITINMIKKLILILALPVLLLSCKKEDAPATCVENSSGVPTGAEIASLQAYLNANYITATQDPGGFFYIIVNPGTGANPSISSSVTVKYTGKLENGTIFDSNSAGVTFILAQLIRGWQLGLPLIRKGGTIQLFLPPTLGYGCTPVRSIPPGSNTIFVIDLIDVQ